MHPAVEAVLTTGPPGKSQSFCPLYKSLAEEELEELVGEPALKKSSQVSLSLEVTFKVSYSESQNKRIPGRENPSDRCSRK